MGERIGIQLRIEPWGAAADHLPADLVVSALPPGVADALAPLSAQAHPVGTVVDVVYRPWPTALSRAAEMAGRRAVGGLPMLVHQAARQVTLQTGCPSPPVGEMLHAAAAALAQDGTTGVRSRSRQAHW
ncbi:hypothetical protein [Streptomyces sp. NPDC021020]|uniref:hypothetical protein n=1 Tax=Streptomyces sp. NPDC021020 TaxID=3365109 RepID=UPI0037A66C0C